MTESALYACDRPSLFERSELWGGVRGGVLGADPDDGKRVHACPLFMVKAKRNEGGFGGDADRGPRSNSPFSLKIALPSAQREHREL